MRAKYHDCGFIYLKETEKNWIIFIARTMNSTVRVSDPQETGVLVFWEADGPSDQELFQCHSFTGCSIRDFSHFGKSEGQLFIPCPSDKRLCVNTSKVNKKWIPEMHPRWLVTVIPFHTAQDDEHAIAEMVPFVFDDNFIDARFMASQNQQ